MKTEFALKFFKPGGAAALPDPPPRTPMAGAVQSCDPKFFTKAELELRQLFEPAKAKVVETT